MTEQTRTSRDAPHASVTAIIPCYNSARFLTRAVASVRAQTRHVEEIIVVDDASTDNSRDIAHQLGVRVVSLAANGGPGAARNAGIAAARADITAFLDADDEWLPEHCEITVGCLERFDSAIVAFGRVRKSGIGCRPSPSSLLCAANQPVHILLNLLRYNFVGQSAAVVRKSSLDAVCGYDPAMRHCEDYDLWLRLANIGEFITTGDITVTHHVHSAQASRAAVKMLNGAWRARLKLLEIVRGGENQVLARSAEAACLDAWAVELKEAWHLDSTALLDATLALEPVVPGASSIARRWAMRRAIEWPLRRLAKQARGALGRRKRRVAPVPLSA